jgi:hypothetical protein
VPITIEVSVLSYINSEQTARASAGRALALGEGRQRGHRRTSLNHLNTCISCRSTGGTSYRAIERMAWTVRKPTDTLQRQGIGGAGDGSTSPRSAVNPYATMQRTDNQSFPPTGALLGSADSSSPRRGTVVCKSIRYMI